MESTLLKSEVVPMLVELGKFIRQRRVALGMSQEELAGRAGLHRTYVSDVERGIRNLTIGASALLANGLGVQLKDMIAAVDHPAAQVVAEKPEQTYFAAAS